MSVLGVADEQLGQPAAERELDFRPPTRNRWKESINSVVGNLVPLVVIALLWEMFARSGIYKRALTPTIEQIAVATVGMLMDGTLIHHIGFTLYRLLTGFCIGAVVGVLIGSLMARSRPIEKFFRPLISVLNPIPALAWIPLFVLWFGLGETATIVLVAFAATIPVIISVWTGAKTVDEVWVRAAQSMGCKGAKMFYKVLLPATIPFIVTGFRGGIGRGWRAVVAGEMIAATAWGLGWVIFNSIAFLNSEVMLSAIIFIGLVGLLLENVVFGVIERATVVKWGMLREVE